MKTYIIAIVWRRRAVARLRGRLAIPVRIRRRILLAISLAGVTAVGRLLVMMMLHLSFEWSVNETINSSERSTESLTDRVAESRN
jgi:hypothetical protein